MVEASGPFLKACNGPRYLPGFIVRASRMEHSSGPRQSLRVGRRRQTANSACRHRRLHFQHRWYCLRRVACPIHELRSLFSFFRLTSQHAEHCLTRGLPIAMDFQHPTNLSTHQAHKLVLFIVPTLGPGPDLVGSLNGFHYQLSLASVMQWTPPRINYSCVLERHLQVPSLTSHV